MSEQRYFAVVESSMNYRLVKKQARKKWRKNVTKKTQENYNTILDAMQLDVWYKAADFKDYVQVKKSRVKELLAELIELGKVESIGSTKGKRNRKVPE